MTFHPGDPSTWCAALTVEQVAAIYQRTPSAVMRACQYGKFVPAPFERRPYRWRKVDVQRHVEGARSLKAVG
jgi:hypothetical protein